MSKHTPGPWRMNGEMYGAINITHNNAEAGAASWILARVTVRDSWRSEQEANARLIAAAPEMFAVLKAIIHRDGAGWTNLNMETLAAAVAAIAKAEGAS